MKNNLSDLEVKVYKTWADASADEKKDPLAFYRKHYSGITRGKLAFLDYPLYRALYRKGLIIKLPTLYGS